MNSATLTHYAHAHACAYPGPAKRDITFGNGRQDQALGILDQRDVKASAALGMSSGRQYW